MMGCSTCKIKKNSKECIKCMHYEPSKYSKFKKCSKNKSLWWECYGMSPDACIGCQYRIVYEYDELKTLLRRRYNRCVKYGL